MFLMQLFNECLFLFFLIEENATVSTDFGYSQTHVGAVYGANQQTNSVVEPHQNYYQVFYALSCYIFPLSVVEPEPLT